MQDSSRIHEKIRVIRKSQKMTLADIARRCHCSISLISQIERGVVTPTFTKIKAIAEVLGISPSELVDESQEPGTASSASSSHMKPDERKVLRMAKGIHYELFSRGLDVPFEFFSIEYGPGVTTTKGPGITHEGVECGILLEGELDVEVNGTVHHLEPGDTVTLLSSVPHKFTNKGEKKAVAIWVDSIPWLFTTK
ncbi:MAG: helix-turn-helix domain-containing protein [Deltaproteobacteria bacterium]|nr:helix-turn-helix domain-containing protein [Deltaproteobacteria bacterium]